jgi:hypothetical protein
LARPKGPAVDPVVVAQKDRQEEEEPARVLARVLAEEYRVRNLAVAEHLAAAEGSKGYLLGGCCYPPSVHHRVPRAAYSLVPFYRYVRQKTP